MLRSAETPAVSAVCDRDCHNNMKAELRTQRWPRGAPYVWAQWKL